MRLIGAVLLCCFCALSWSAEAPERPTDFRIGPQSLASALLQFSSQSGIQVLAADARLAERTVRGVRGRMTATAALRTLLSGSGLSFRRIDALTIAVFRGSDGDILRPRAPGSVLPRAPASAAESPDAAAGAEQEMIEEVEVVQITGTRIRLPDITSANPVTSITGEEMQRLGIVNVGDALLQLVPQNISTYMNALTGDSATYTGNDTGGIGGPGSGNQLFDRGSFFIGNTIANLRGLDPMFGSRTLTMIDGRRVVSTSNQADVVDLNIIPSNLLLRMDVVTGGASSTYGSGAMAGVVNLVLNKRLNGVSLDLDYGMNAAGDGDSPHAAFSGGMPLFGGRGHALLGVEWQNQSAIQACGRARQWCTQSRALFNNFAGSTSAVPSPPVVPNVNNVLVPLPGFATSPARLRVSNLRYSQFAPPGTIYSSDVNNTSGFRFTGDGAHIEEYSYGYRGGANVATAINGDGPPLSSSQTLRPSTERGAAFMNLEYAFNEHATGYLQGSYARTDSLNRNPYTQGTTCVRFNTAGVAAQPGGSARAGTDIAYGGNGEAFTNPLNGGAPVADFPRNALWSNANFRAFLGVPTGRVAPYFIVPGQNGSTNTTPPVFNFLNATNPVWQRITSAQGTAYWNLVKVTLSADFEDPGVPAVLPQTGRNAYAFLAQLSPEALYQVQRSFNNSPTAGSGNSALAALFGSAPCGGFTAIRKVWNPQIQQWTSQESQTWRAVAGVSGRLGSDWRWETYYQYGRTDSSSRQNNVQTNLSFAFAMDAVIDDRAGAATFGKPVCRISRDGVPVVDNTGRPMSDPAGLAAVAAGCRPLNVFGTTFTDPAAAALQREALDYAFKENISDGANSLQVLSLTTSGTLWQGWAGPLSGAFGVEFREDTVDNQGSRGPYYLRADIARAWGDAFGGSTRVTEAFTELNMPLASGRPVVNLWMVNAGARYASYYNKGGAGTTGQSLTQDTLNWKFQTIFEPFDWIRLRLTRSRDLRAAGYRDLFLNQPGIPDQAYDINPWRARTPESAENQYERWGFVRVGNAGLKPERSDTLTIGLVLSPGGWAQGMRFSADYYTTQLKNGIYTPFNFTSPIRSCWERSGNIDAATDPDHAVNGLFNADLPECREITFAPLADAGGVAVPGTRDLQDIVAYNASRPINSLLYQRRGLDLTWNYQFALNRLSARLPGSMALTVRATRALESSGFQQSCGSFTSVNNTVQCVDSFSYVDLVGQIRSNAFIPGVAATPRWSGNLISSWLLDDLTLTLSARYTGGARLDNSWSDGPDGPTWQNAAGQFLVGSVDDNHVKPWLNYSLNGSYGLRIAKVQDFQVFGSINNLLDKAPPFTGGGISGASAQYHDIMGRAWRIGVRMRF